MSRNSLYLSILFSLFLSCSNDADVNTIQHIAENIQNKFAPDKRVALFSVDTILGGLKPIIKGETNMAEAKNEFIQMLKARNIEFTDSFSVLPSPGLEGKHFGIVNVSVCNIRSKRGHSQELATQALLGTPLRVWKEDHGFYLVQTPDDYFGWLDDGGFQLMDSTDYQAWQKSERLVVLEDYVFAYEQADSRSPKVSDLLAGNIINGSKSNRQFSRVTFPDGRTGFVLSEKLMPYGKWMASRNPVSANLVSSAFEMMGRPYLWGGTSGKGVDCSGFTKMVFYLNGLLLPRDASQQVHVGEEIRSDTTFSNLQAGDLLFFGRKAAEEQKERITHVGMYIGDGKLIHSANKVEVISLLRGEPGFSEYRITSFVRAKRMIGSNLNNRAMLLSESSYY